MSAAKGATENKYENNSEKVKHNKKPFVSAYKLKRVNGANRNSG